MKNKDIIIDFTSLLDVTLIIIFFFIIFGNVDTDTRTKQIMEEAQAVKAQAELTKEQAEQMLSDAEQLTDKDLHILKFYLNTGRYGWSLDMYSTNSSFAVGTFEDNEQVYRIDYQTDEQLEAEIVEFFKQNGFSEESLILCELMSDDSLENTNSAHRSLDRVLTDVRQTYRTFYISKTDISDHREVENNE